MTVKQGWTGRVYEDFEVGDIYQHPLGRTVIAADNIWFTLLTQNTNPIHFDAAYSAQTEYGKPLVDSTFTLALVTGQGASADVQPYQAGDGRGFWNIQWGTSGDVPVVGDGNGDALLDIAVWRPSEGNWYWRLFPTVEWGVSGDVPVT